MRFCVRSFTNNHTVGSNGTAIVGSNRTPIVGSNGTPIYITLLAFLEGRKIGSTKILTKTPEKVQRAPPEVSHKRKLFRRNRSVDV